MSYDVIASYVVIYCSVIFVLILLYISVALECISNIVFSAYFNKKSDSVVGSFSSNSV